MAGRIPDRFIQDLLARIDLVDLIGARLDLQRAGREFRARSPFTNEKTPSFFVSPAKQMWFDFSSGKNGNAIGFLIEHDRLSFVEAVEELAQIAGVEVPREGGEFTRVVLDGPLDALALAERYYRAQLKQQPAAVEYLRKRGVSGETARVFGIGYAPDAWDALAAQFPDPRHALTAGLLIEREGGRGGAYDRFRNRIMFPIRDTRGRVIAFGGRTLANDPAKYLNSPETPLFHKGRNLFGLYEAKQASTGELPYLLVVEGYMDVVMLAQHGISGVVATLGTATTREHLALLFKSTAKVVFCFDGDAAGRRAAWKALDQALPEVYEGRDCRFMFLPDGQDPDTLVQAIGAEAYRERIAQALPLSEFLLGGLAERVDMVTREGRARLVALAQPYVARLREGPLKAAVVEELARRARLRREDVETAVQTPARAVPPAEPLATAAAVPELAPLVRRALRLLLEHAALAQTTGDLDVLLQSRQAGADILVMVLDEFIEHPELNAAQLLLRWQDTPQAAALQAVLQEPVALQDDDGIEQEFAGTLRQLRQRAVRARIEELLQASSARALADAEQRELAVLTQQLSRARVV